MCDRVSLNYLKVVLALLIGTGIALVGLVGVAWATPAQDPLRQTIPTPTPPPVVGVVDPVITKRVIPEKALPGELVTYTLEATNHGNLAAVDVVVVDEVPEYLEILTVATTQGTVTIEGQKVIVNIGVIGPQFIVEITIETRVRPDTPRPVDLLNVATLISPNGGTRETPPVRVWVPGFLPETGGEERSWTSILLLSLALIGLGLLALRRSIRLQA